MYNISSTLVMSNSLIIQLYRRYTAMSHGFVRYAVLLSPLTPYSGSLAFFKANDWNNICAQVVRSLCDGLWLKTNQSSFTHPTLCLNMPFSSVVQPDNSQWLSIDSGCYHPTCPCFTGQRHQCITQSYWTISHPYSWSSSFQSHIEKKIKGWLRLSGIGLHIFEEDGMGAIVGMWLDEITGRLNLIWDGAWESIIPPQLDNSLFINYCPGSARNSVRSWTPPSIRQLNLNPTSLIPLKDTMGETARHIFVLLKVW